MIYTLSEKGKQSAVFVPAFLTDEHLRICNECQLKVMLCICGANGTNEDEISRKLNIDKKDVADAILYWSMTGLIASSAETSNKKTAEKEENEEGGAKPFVISDSAASSTGSPVSHFNDRLPSRPSSDEIAARIKEDPNISDLLKEAQIKLGKTLGHNGNCVLVLLYDHYGLPVEVIYMLLEFCSSLGKTNFAYIESVGRDWGINEIDTIEKAAARITAVNSANANWAEFSRYAGIKTPKPTKKQTEYFVKWFLDMKFTVDAVEQAYDTACEKTGKISFAYMDKILTGIFAGRSNEKAKSKTNFAERPAKKSFAQPAQGGEASYDIEKFKNESQKPLVYKRKGKA
ncbi:MAG: DnaD domain protein [Clostridiales bacterium]|nr:DnaD domain protein [Clostridiales bacterium]